ncbi:MAG: sigma factor [Syntrophomonadaceae bacterium]|jgi:RNA polymerase sigma factor
MYSPEQTSLSSMLDQVWKDYHNGDKEALDNIYEHLMPFCLRVSSKTCGRYISDHDEEASIARLAIIETLEKYDPDKGSGLVFLGQTIRTRIIDYKRKEKKHSLLPVTFLTRNGSSLTGDVEECFFEEILDDLARSQEIEKLKSILGEFNIGFEELVQVSPRQTRSRQNVNRIIDIIVADDELSSYLMEKKMLPMKDMEETWQVNRKLADRYRKYIITAVIIQLNDFPYLRSFILPEARGEQKWQTEKA